MAEDNKSAIELEQTFKRINRMRIEMGKTPLVDMDGIKDLPGLLEASKQELSDMDGSATNLYERLQGITSELKGQQTPLQKSRAAFNSITSASIKLLQHEQGISKLNSKQLQQLKQKAKESKNLIELGAKDIRQHNDAYRDIQAELAEFAKETNATEDELLIHKKHLFDTTKGITEEQKSILQATKGESKALQEIIEQANKRLKVEQEIDEAVGGYSKLATFVKSIPGLKAFAQPFEKAATAARDAYESTKSQKEALKAAGKEIGKSMLVKTISLAAAFTFIKDAVFSVNKQQVEIGKNQGLSISQTRKQFEIYKKIGDTTNQFGVRTGNIVEAQSELTSSLGAARGFTSKQLTDQILLTKQIGLQANTAGQLQGLAMASGESSEESLDSIISATQALKLQTGIQLDQKGVLDEVAKTDGQVAANYKNNPGLIAKAVMQTRKLGITLAQAAKMSSSLLNFETSIGTEMEAELLLGRDLNFDKARALALSGDAAGAAAEIRKQTGSSAQFGKLNVIQQEALAKAAGMTADELANSLRQEEQLNKLGANTKKQIQDRVKELKAQGLTEQANRLLSQTANAEDAKAGLKRVSLEMQLSEAIQKTKEKIGEMLTSSGGVEVIVGNIVDLFTSLPQMLGTIKTVLSVVGGLMVAFKVASLGAAVAQALIAAGAIATASAVSMGFGIAAVLGGIAAGAIAFNSMSSDASANTKSKMKDGVIGPGGETIVSGPKGSIQLNKQDSMIVGTNLGGGGNGGGSSTNTLISRIDKLISIVEKGGNVYLDGSKVGEALVLSSNLSS